MDSGSKTNEPEAQGLDLHLCIICQKKKNENLVEKPEAHEKVSRRRRSIDRKME